MDLEWPAGSDAGAGTEVGRVTAYARDGDRLQFYRVTGFDEIADAHFTVSTVKTERPIGA